MRCKACVCDLSLAGILGSNIAEGVDVSCECCVLSGRGLCVGLITNPEKSHRVWCVLSVIVKPDNEEVFAPWGLLRHGGKE